MERLEVVAKQKGEDAFSRCGLFSALLSEAGFMRASGYCAWQSLDTEKGSPAEEVYPRLGYT
jgi:hypothetical protein